VEKWSFEHPTIRRLTSLCRHQLSPIAHEETANISHIQLCARILYEINCSERMLRELSISVQTDDGKEGSREKPTEWKHVPPEGNGASLLKILCPVR
jgi:hypothetical protein